MKEKKEGRGTQLVPVLPTTDPQLDSLRNVLGGYLVHVRPIPNGRDFLFSGPMDAVENAARALAERETSAGATIQIDMVRLDEVFLLRMRGPRGSGIRIRDYFKLRGSGTGQ